MRFFAFLEYTFVIVGAIGMVAARYFYLPKGFHLGLFMIGAGLALGGLESLAMRRMSFRFATYNDRYDGAPAVIWGLMILGIGAALIAAAYLMEANLWHTTAARLTRHPGPVIAGGGLLALGTGSLLMFNRGPGGVWRTILIRIPKTLIGLLLVVGGLTAVALGILEWVDPRLYTRYLREILAYLGLVQRWAHGIIARFL